MQFITPKMLYCALNSENMTQTQVGSGPAIGKACRHSLLKSVSENIVRDMPVATKI